MKAFLNTTAHASSSLDDDGVDYGSLEHVLHVSEQLKLEALQIGERLGQQADRITREYHEKIDALPEGAVKTMAKTW